MLKKVLIVAAVLVGLAGMVALAPGIYYMMRRGDRLLLERLVDLDSPEVIRSLELRDGGGVVLWALENPDGAEVREIDYGDVPVGLVQAFPERDPPRPLIQGEELILMYILADGRFLHAKIEPVRPDRYFYGVSIRGDGCDTMDCVETIATLPWTEPPEVPPLHPPPVPPAGPDDTKTMNSPPGEMP